MRIRAIAGLALTASCTTPTSSSEAVHPLHSIDGRVAGPEVQCVRQMPQEGLRVIDSGTLSYRVGTTVYRTEVEPACPRLHPQSTIVVDTIGSRYCSGDRIRVVDPGASTPGHSCTIGPFTPYLPAG